MKTKAFALAASILLGSSMLFAQKPTAGEEDKMAAQAADSVGSEQAQATREIMVRALSAIPLARASTGLRILPFVDQQGQPVAMERPLLAFHILPFPDSRGNLIPILKTGPAILPFVDLAGEPIAIGKAEPRIEPISQ